jgi:outer membrane lipoprotein SlyB
MIDEIRKRLQRVPFIPFSVRTSDGHEYSVPRQDHAFITPRGNRVVVFDDEGTTAVLGPLHINGVVQQQNGE